MIGHGGLLSVFLHSPLDLQPLLRPSSPSTLKLLSVVSEQPQQICMRSKQQSIRYHAHKIFGQPWIESNVQCIFDHKVFLETQCQQM